MGRLDAPGLGLISLDCVFCPCHKSQALCLLLRQEFVFVLLAGYSVRAEIRAEEAGKIDENHNIQHEQDTQQKGALGPLAC